MKYNSAMIDLEFLNTRPSSAILAIAIVPMNTLTKEIGEGTKINVDADDCMRRGMTVSADTIRFWTKQDAAAFDDAFDPQARYRNTLELSLVKVTNVLSDIASRGNIEIWQQGSLDAAILEHGYDLFGKQPPWEFWNVNDLRTLIKQYPMLELPSPGTNKHQCLADATIQAKRLMAVLSHIEAAETALSSQGEKAAPAQQEAKAPKTLASLDDDL